MRGANISYDVRPNKFIERSLYIDLLGALINKSEDNYVYISLGGPQLEDQKLIHYQLGLKKLISLESNKLVYDRQLFNKRPGCIECRNQSVDEFIADFTSIDEKFPEDDFLIWLDYASVNERYQQLTEFESLIKTLNVGDVIKITLNANVTTLGTKQGTESSEDLQRRRYAEAIRTLGEYFSEDENEPSDMTRAGFLRVMRKCIQNAIIRGLPDHLFSKTMLSFNYADGPHIMLNVAIALFDSEENLQEASQRVSSKWDFIPENEEQIFEINMPSLSVKERLHIDGEMYRNSIQEIHDSLPFSFASNKASSLSILTQYFNHYRKYPGYLSVKI